MSGNYDNLIPINDTLIFNRAVTNNDDGTGLTYAFTDYDFTGVPFQTEDLSGTTGDTYGHSATACCVLVGPADETHYAISAGHAGLYHVGDRIDWVNRDNTIVSRTVASISVLGSGDYSCRVYELSAPINAATDKLKIYPVAANTTELIGKQLLCIEQDRRCTIRELSGFYSNYVTHSLLIDGAVLEGGDSGKSAFVVKQGELYLVLIGMVTASSGPSVAYYLDGIDGILDGNGEALERVVLLQGSQEKIYDVAQDVCFSVSY